MIPTQTHPALVGPVPTSRASHLEALLKERVDHHLLPLGLLADRGAGAFRACVQNGELMGVAYLGRDGVVIPAAIKSVSAAREIGASLRGTEVRVLLGERQAVGGVLAGLQVPRVPGRDERLYTLTADDMGPYVTNELARATDADGPSLVEATAAYYTERRLPPPAEGVEALVAAQVRGGRVWVIRREGKVVFRVDVDTQSRHGAHLDRVWTHPAWRRKELASLGLGQLCRSLLSHLPRLTILADDADPAASTVVRRVGFGPAVGWRRVEVPSEDEVDPMDLLDL